MSSQSGEAPAPVPGPAEAEWQRRLVDCIPAAAYTCDAQGLITYYNEHAKELWGRAPRLNDPADRYCGSFRLYYPDGTPMPREACWTALALSTGRDHRECEALVERPDGRRIAVLANASPVHDSSGGLLGAVNVMIGIDERRRAVETGNLLASIVESSDDAIVSKTQQGRVMSWNEGATRLFGYTADEMLGENITRIIPEERLFEEEDVLAKIRRGERIDHYETERVSKDGRRIPISLTVSPLRDARGRIIGASTVARDISDRKRAEESLKEADRRKNEFLAMLAHELRNPLASIRNAVEVIKLSRANPAALDHATGILDRQVGSIVRLIDDLWDVARVVQGRLELRKERIELARVVREAVEAARPLIDSRGHTLRLDLPAEPMWLDADPVRLVQVFLNLLNNAAKYTPEGGTLDVSAARQAHEVVVRVKDTGIGIPPDQLECVFDMWVQSSETAASAQGGLGVGLNLAKRLVELHGGRIRAASEGAGRGSEFIVRLPLYSAAPLRAGAADRHGRDASSQRGESPAAEQ